MSWAMRNVTITIPKGLHPPAQGLLAIYRSCEGRATLGRIAPEDLPRRGCVHPSSASCRNPFRVDPPAASCSPSPIPSPSGRANTGARLAGNTVGFDSRTDWGRFSLSPGERAGVRGNEANEQQSKISSACKRPPGWLALFSCWRPATEPLRNAQIFNFQSAFWILLCLTALPALGETILLTGATVHTVSGETLAPGQVLIRDGKIAAVGKTVPASGATSISLKGQHLYPGMIALNSMLGLVEIEAIRATRDATEVGDYTPDVESWIAVNPDSDVISVTRANGIACFEPVPQGGVVSGQSGLVSVEGWTMEQRTIRKPVALHLFWPALELDPAPKERSKNPAKWKSLEDQDKDRRTKVQATEDFFEEAKAYAKAKDAAASGSAPAPESIPAWEAMLPYVRGQLPITVHADEIRQIRAAVQWAATNHYKIILTGARDAWRAAQLLASNNVPVVYEQTFLLPHRDTDSYEAQFKAPALLQAAGVKVAFSYGADSLHAAIAKNLPYTAAQAVAFGLPDVEALKGLTLYPAQIAGVDDRFGSIEPGKDATLFAADGDILDIRSNIKRMWIAGKEISLENRHTRLYEKYKNRPRTGE